LEEAETPLKSLEEEEEFKKIDRLIHCALARVKWGETRFLSFDRNLPPSPPQKGAPHEEQQRRVEPKKK
jgi:hypothetical protein